MENNGEKQGFSFTYSSKQQEEIRRIRQKYQPAPEDKMEQLRKLDESATRPGKVAALSLGVLGCLIMGTGMSCAMVWAGKWFIPGIIIGLVGIVVDVVLYLVSYRVQNKWVFAPDQPAADKKETK